MTIVTVNNFATFFIPVYYRAVTPEAIRNGFSSTGLCPWNRETPDYTKITSDVGLSNHAPLQGIDVNGKKEQGVQTGTGVFLNKYSQISKPIITRDYVDYVLKIPPRIPSNTSRANGANASRYAWDDTVVQCHKYANVREMVSNQHRLPMKYPRVPTGRALKYIVYDNGGSEFPTGHYNKCGKFKPRNYKVGTSAYKSLKNYQ